MEAAPASHAMTGVSELDRVLGGGLVPGSATLVAGEPGIGKSTLVLQALASLARAGSRCLLISAEESPQQVRLRAERLGAIHPGLFLAGDSDLGAIAAAIDHVRPAVVAVDSVQTISSSEIGSLPGSVTQVRECAAALVRLAKQSAVATILIGHVTKEGALAGPRTLEHLVDTVLSFEGDRHYALRTVRAVKHRFGSTGEVGLFEMGDGGLRPVPDPSGLFLGDRHAGAAGSVVVPAMEGRRPLLVEVQALVSSTSLAQPRRSALGLDAGRAGLLIAVLSRHCDVDLSKLDVYVSAVGGIRVVEPAADLAVALALISANKAQPLPDDLVVIGEVGLAGELRQVTHTPRRLSEAHRLGFARAIVPASCTDSGRGMRVMRASSLVAAQALAFDGGRRAGHN